MNYLMVNILQPSPPTLCPHFAMATKATATEDEEIAQRRKAFEQRRKMMEKRISNIDYCTNMIYKIRAICDRNEIKYPTELENYKPTHTYNDRDILSIGYMLRRVEDLVIARSKGIIDKDFAKLMSEKIKEKEYRSREIALLLRNYEEKKEFCENRRKPLLDKYAYLANYVCINELNAEIYLQFLQIISKIGWTQHSDSSVKDPSFKPSSDFEISCGRAMSDINRTYYSYHLEIICGITKLKVEQEKLEEEIAKLQANLENYKK